MKNENIVKQEVKRSSSSESIRLSNFNQDRGKKNILQQSLRETSLQGKFEKTNEPNNSIKSKAAECSFIKPKTSIKKYRSSSFKKLETYSKRINTSELEISSKKMNTEEIIYQEFIVINDIVNKFTLKTIEKMKKDYVTTSNHEKIYRSILALLSELDIIFNENQVLQFSMSKARDIFQMYMSRIGHVLKTFKSLSTLTSTTRISKYIISQCRNQIKGISKEKLESPLLEVYEIINNIISAQEKIFKTEKLFISKEPDPRRTKFREVLYTEERNLDVSVMEIHTLHTENDNGSVSPLITLESEENNEGFSVETCKENKSSKLKLLEKLYSKMNYKIEKDEPQTIENSILAEENYVVDADNCKMLNGENISDICIKPKLPRKCSLGSFRPNYMRNLKKSIDLSRENKKTVTKSNKNGVKENKSKDRRQE